MRTRFLPMAAAAVFAACAESPALTTDVELDASVSGNSRGEVVGFAGGSGHSLCTPDGVDCRAEVGGLSLLERYPGLEAGDLALRTFTVTAERYEDGTAGGKVQFNNRGRALSWDADVECVLFRSGSGKPNQVWILGRLTRGYGGGGSYAPGVGVLFAVEDNGEGRHGAPDRVVGLATVPEPNYQAICPLFNQQVEVLPFDGFFSFFSFEAVRGNIQVRPPSN